MREANNQASQRRCENKQCPSQYAYYEGESCPTCNQALAGDRQPEASKTPSESTLASATGYASREQKLYDALKRITQYSQPERIRKTAERDYGLSGDEAVEMAYENVLAEASAAIRGMRRPK